MNTSNMVRQSVAVALVSMLAGCASWNGMSHQSKATTEGATGGAIVGAAVGGPVGAAVGAGVGGVVAHNNAESIPTPNLPTNTARNNTPSSSNGYGSSSNSTSSNAAIRNETANPPSGNAATGTANSTNANPQSNVGNDNESAGNASNMSGSQLDNDQQVVREAQRALNDKGFSAGAVDGVMGPHTEQALRDFQQSQGLNATGNLDQPTLSALGVSG